MKVLAAIIAPPHLSASGGVRAGVRLSEALGARCDMTLASMSEIDRNRRTNVTEAPVRTFVAQPLRALPMKYRSLFYSSDLPALVRCGNWDLVHLHNPMPALEMERVAAACTASGVPYIVSTHGFNEVANGESVYGFGLARKLVWRACMSGPVARVVRGAAAVFALSPADIGIIRDFGFAGDVVIVPNGVDMSAHNDPVADLEVWRRHGILPPEEATGITCMFLGNHTPNKGVPVLLDAVARLNCPYQLIVGGETRPEIDYATLATTTRPDQRVVVTGRLSDQDIGALLRRTDLFVFPTLADTFPLVVLEAMAHGCALLASEVGGIPHQLDQDCGVLVPPGDPAALADAVERLGRQPARLAAMGAHAKARVRAEFTWDTTAGRALNGYRQVLEQTRTHAASGQIQPASAAS